MSESSSLKEKRRSVQERLRRLENMARLIEEDPPFNHLIGGVDVRVKEFMTLFLETLWDKRTSVEGYALGYRGKSRPVRTPNPVFEAFIARAIPRGTRQRLVRLELARKRFYRRYRAMRPIDTLSPANVAKVEALVKTFRQKQGQGGSR